MSKETKGKVDFRNPVEVNQLIFFIRHMEKLINEHPKMKSVYTYAFKKFFPKRSINQNDYYWGAVIDPLADFLGYIPDDMHKELALKFIPKHLTNRITGEVSKIGKSTTELTTVEFEQYLENIRIWAAVELEFIIQLPNEYLEV